MNQTVAGNQRDFEKVSSHVALNNPFARFNLVNFEPVNFKLSIEIGNMNVTISHSTLTLLVTP